MVEEPHERLESLEGAPSDVARRLIERLARQCERKGSRGCLTRAWVKGLREFDYEVNDFSDMEAVVHG